MKETKKIKVKLVHSGIASIPRHRETIKGLGLRKLQSERVLLDTPEVRGMLAKVSHLVKIIEVL